VPGLDGEYPHLFHVNERSARGHPTVEVAGIQRQMDHGWTVQDLHLRSPRHD
jgi:hypothetical protein